MAWIPNGNVTVAKKYDKGTDLCDCLTLAVQFYEDVKI